MNTCVVYYNDCRFTILYTTTVLQPEWTMTFVSTHSQQAFLWSQNTRAHTYTYTHIHTHTHGQILFASAFHPSFGEKMYQIAENASKFKACVIVRKVRVLYICILIRGGRRIKCLLYSILIERLLYCVSIERLLYSILTFDVCYRLNVCCTLFQLNVCCTLSE